MLLSVLKNGLLEASGLSEFEGDLLVGELLINLDESLDLVFNLLLVKRVKEDLDNLGASGVNSEVSTDDMGGGDNILKDGIVNGSESSSSGSGLLGRSYIINGGFLPHFDWMVLLAVTMTSVFLNFFSRAETTACLVFLKAGRDLKGILTRRAWLDLSATSTFSAPVI